MRRQAEMVAELVNLAVPGQRQGSEYAPPPDAEVLAQLGDGSSGGPSGGLSAATRELLGSAPDSAERLVALARRLHAVLVAPDMAAVAERLNALIASCHALPYLTNDVGQPYHLHFHGTGKHPVDVMGGEWATALALVVDMLGEDRFGACEAHACDRVYVDLTRNGRRRYCSNACASRAKTAAYRGRRRDPAATRSGH
jgi:predicted RNA-binding Zn ribbon-like protein